MRKRSFLASLATLLLGATVIPATRAAEAQPSELPQVLIIGDSISIGYTPFVAKLLKTEAVIAHNPGNAAHTGTGLEKIDAWIGSTPWKLIHFNWGLHDLCYRNPGSKASRDKVNGKLTTSLEQYEKNLDQLVTRLKKTGATLVWAHTTVVPEGESGRIAGDHRKYNEAATRVMKQHGVAINDLQTLSEGFAPDLFVKAGNVHFKPAGYEVLAKQVAEQIRAALKGSAK